MVIGYVLKDDDFLETIPKNSLRTSSDYMMKKYLNLKGRSESNPTSSLKLINEIDSKEKSIETLFSEKYVRLLRLATLLLNNSHLAEDVVQEAFVSTFQSWKKIRHDQAKDSYLRICVINGCKSRIKRQIVQDKKSSFLKNNALFEAKLKSMFSIKDFQVYEAVSTLPLKQRAAIVLKYWLDLPEKEIAIALKCSPGTIKSQLAKARIKLAELLKDDVTLLTDRSGDVK